MASIRFLTLEEVLEIHADQLDLYGGGDGLREPGLLASAVAMPMLTFADQYAHPDLPAMAAAYLFHICANHPFVDGNKRTAAQAMDVFLTMNGQLLTLSADDVAELTLGIASGRMDKWPAAEVIRAHLTPFDPLA